MSIIEAKHFEHGKQRRVQKIDYRSEKTRDNRDESR